MTINRDGQWLGLSRHWEFSRLRRRRPVKMFPPGKMAKFADLNLGVSDNLHTVECDRGPHFLKISATIPTLKSGFF